MNGNKILEVDSVSNQKKSKYQRNSRGRMTVSHWQWQKSLEGKAENEVGRGLAGSQFA